MTITALETTVGTPIAITGILIVLKDISPWLLPIPRPGSNPVLVIWIVFWIRLIFKAAKASIAITKSGLILLIVPKIISKEEMPVLPKTLGSKIATLR